MINNWVCLDDDYVFAEWILKVEFINLLEMQIFTRELLISGQETKQLIITHPLHDNEEEAIQYYLKCLFTVYEQKKIYYFFEVGKIINF